MRHRGESARGRHGYFNPRTHVGCDAASSVAIGSTIGISIHAPTWGATPLITGDYERARISIHAPTWGATKVSVEQLTRFMISIHAPTWGATIGKNTFTITELFQSTHPRGVRRSYSLTAVITSNFNPRTHVGCDSDLEAYLQHKIISIHAPTWGATNKG